MDRIYTNFHQNSLKLRLFSAADAFIHKNPLKLFVKTTAHPVAVFVKPQQNAIGLRSSCDSCPIFCRQILASALKNTVNGNPPAALPKVFDKSVPARPAMAMGKPNGWRTKKRTVDVAAVYAKVIERVFELTPAAIQQQVIAHRPHAALSGLLT